MKRLKAALLLSLLPIVLGLSFFQALGWFSIYREPHVYRQASEWIYANIPKRSRLLGVHWDDKLPLSLPGRSAHQYRFEGAENELELYEPDYRNLEKKILNEKKFLDIRNKLSSADYIILPTQRLPGSLLRVPEEYPYTVAMLRLLYGEKLGYRLVRTFKTRPSFASLVVDDDSADESLSVYDHPRVAVFKNVEGLSAETLAGRIAGFRAFEPLPDLKAVMEMESPPVTVTPLHVSLWREIGSVLLWLLALELLGLAMFPLVALLLPGAPDYGYALTKAFALLLCTALCWLVSVFGIYPFAALTFILPALLVAFCAVSLGWSYFESVRLALIRARTEILSAEVLFLAVFIFFVGLRALTPEIFWGEKPMDFTFLNYFIRLDRLPPGDPWAAGSGMSYYYLGTAMFALLHKLTGVDSGIGYNLSIASIAALLGCSLYGLLLWLGRNTRFAFTAALLILFMANFEVLRLLLFADEQPDFDLFWASTRLFTSPSFAEYPLWALLFADLHAHVIALPFGVLLLAMLYALFSEGHRQHHLMLLLQRFLLGFFWGMFFLLNSWDLISSGVICLLAVFCSFLTRQKGVGLSFFQKSAHLASEVLAALSGIVLSLGISLLSASSLRIGTGWVRNGEFNTFWQIFRHFGVWWIIAGFAVLILGFRAYAASLRLSLKPLLFSGAAALVPLIPALLSIWWFESSIPWGIVAAAVALSFTGFFLILSADYLVKHDAAALRLSGIMLFSSGVLLSLCEFCYLMDRMNTIFKTYNALWYWQAVPALLLAFLAYQRVETSTAQRCLRNSGLVCAALVILLSLAGGAIDIWIMAGEQKIEGPRPTLNGLAYLNENNKEEAAAIAWLRSNVKGAPVILEAFGPSYQSYSRVSMNTGLPTVLGWEHHVYQRGTPRNEIARRRYDLKKVYTGSSLEDAQRIIRRYGIRLIFAGSLEKRTYGPAGLEKFSANPELFPVLFRSGETTVYGVQTGLWQ